MQAGALVVHMLQKTRQNEKPCARAEVIPMHAKNPNCPLPLQFPDPDNGLHRLLAGLIMLAVSLPTKRVIERLFELSNGAGGDLRDGIDECGCYSAVLHPGVYPLPCPLHPTRFLSDPIGYEDFWLQNIGIGKLMAGHISWYYSEPGKKARRRAGYR